MTDQTRVVHIADEVPGAVYIGRAMPRRLKKSPFANPYKIGPDMTRAHALELYESHILESPALLTRLPELRGKPLACWCRHDGQVRTRENFCHGDILVGLLETHTDDELRAMAEAIDDQEG